mmetsp:Transcript_1606/g.5801  ORF Transcript_1606/g.5801 Transcript_1606/m.5801 type:complete len:306 (+) Transcript_1606:2-919(+)
MYTRAIRRPWSLPTAQNYEKWRRASGGGDSHAGGACGVVGGRAPVCGRAAVCGRVGSAEVVHHREEFVKGELAVAGDVVARDALFHSLLREPLDAQRPRGVDDVLGVHLARVGDVHARKRDVHQRVDEVLRVCEERGSQLVPRYDARAIQVGVVEGVVQVLGADARALCGGVELAAPDDARGVKVEPVKDFIRSYEKVVELRGVGRIGRRGRGGRRGDDAERQGLDAVHGDSAQAPQGLDGQRVVRGQLLEILDPVELERLCRRGPLLRVRRRQAAHHVDRFFGDGPPLPFPKVDEVVDVCAGEG